MKIFVVRHGQTEWNKKGVIQGHSAIPLNEKGKRHAKHIANFLKNKNISIIYSSDLLRAKQTAQTVSKATKAKIVFTKALREMNMGKLVGLTHQQIPKKFPSYEQCKKLNHYRALGPKSESYFMVEKRVTPFLQKILSSYKKQSVALVAHEAVNRVILRLLLELEKNETVKIAHPNDCIYEVDIHEKKVVRYHEGKKHKGLLKRV